jgi:hypothetical protein
MHNQQLSHTQKLMIDTRQLITHEHASIFLVLLSLAISIKLFFSSTSIPWSFTRDSVEWYVNFSKEIFHPGYFLKGAYFTESMLMPAVANAFGAARSFEAYKIFCSLMTISILPLWTMAYARRTSNPLKTFLFIVLAATCFHYFYDYVLGFPDPLTILILGLIALQQNNRTLVFLIVLACLSHFFLAIISIVSLILLVACSPHLSKDKKFSLLKYSILGIFLGKLLLMTWLWAFDYHPISRLQWAIDNGITVFIQNYTRLGIDFWLTPGIYFLLFYLAACSIFFFKRYFLFSLAAFFSLTISYCALFFTVDGYRILAVAITAPYIYITIEFIECLFYRNQRP